MGNFKEHRELLSCLVMLGLFLLGPGGIIAYSGWEEIRVYLAKVGWGQFFMLLALPGGIYVLRANRWHIFAKALRLGTGFGLNLGKL